MTSPLNPYSVCSFGCTYCCAAFFSRNTQRRDSWSKWIPAKENAIALPAKRKPGDLDGKLTYMSSITDPYQPVERELRITSGLLELMAKRHKPKLVAQTRRPLAARDCKLFQRIVKNDGRVQVNMTVTTDDEDIRRAFELFCPSNPRRLEAIKKCKTPGLQPALR